MATCIDFLRASSCGFAVLRQDRAFEHRLLLPHINQGQGIYAIFCKRKSRKEICSTGMVFIIISLNLSRSA